VLAYLIIEDERLLSRVEQSIHEGVQHIAQQTKRIEFLRSPGRDIRFAKEILETLD
jgi:hypothetical protein